VIDKINPALKGLVVPLKDLKPDPANARKHNAKNIQAIKDSFEKFGQQKPIVALKDGTVIAGNGTLEALQELGWTKCAVVRFDMKDKAMATAYALADNQTTDLSSWDEEALAASLKSIQVEIPTFNLGTIGFNQGDVLKLLGGNDKPIEGTLPLPRKTDIKPGDIFGLGDHQLKCGDALDGPLDKETIFFDPPYDANPAILSLRGRCENALIFTDNRHLFDCVGNWNIPFKSVFVWDGVTSWFTPGWPLARAKLCLWFGDGKYKSDGAFYGEAGEDHEVTNTRGSYQYHADPRGKHLSTVFKYPLTQRGKEHPHEKPLDWITMLIANCTSGEVYDPFAGSGTSLISCEILGRKWTGKELEPSYVQLIIDRWENFTKRKANKC
jgi:hypothetical protein